MHGYCFYRLSCLTPTQVAPAIVLQLYNNQFACMFHTSMLLHLHKYTSNWEKSTMCMFPRYWWVQFTFTNRCHYKKLESPFLVAWMIHQVGSKNREQWKWIICYLFSKLHTYVLVCVNTTNQLLYFQQLLSAIVSWNFIWIRAKAVAP